MDPKAFRRLMTRPADTVLTAPLAIDALSASLAVEMGFGAVYLGGGALGYQRGVSEALLTATEVAEATRAITERVDVAVVVDGTTGFGDAVHTWRTVRMLEQAGAAAIEIEDQLAPKRAHHQKGIDHMIAADEMVGKIEAAVQARTDPDLLIIARCNSLQHDDLDDALQRIAAYAAAGADMLLLLPRDDDELRAVSTNSDVPLVGWVAMMPPAGRTDDQLVDAGFCLKLDAFSATVFGYRALRAGYEMLRDGPELPGGLTEVLKEFRPIGSTIGIETLYEIEARTTERELYENGATPVGWSGLEDASEAKPTARPPESSRPLSDIRVLDLTSARAGPTCVRQFADWGADVIRVEPLVRRTADLGDRHGSDFQNLHRNKRSLTLDLKSDAGRALFFDLVKTSDVVVENMRPQVKHRLGIAYEDLREVNPGLVYGSISGFGQDGVGAARGGVDQIAQGMGGLMSVTGYPETGPVRAGVPVTDLTAGVYLAVGILIALHERQRTGRGRWVRTSLLESTIALLDFQAARWTIDHEVPGQQGNHHPTAVPMGCYQTADAHINVAAWDGPLWEAFARVIGRPDLLDDARFATLTDRLAHRDELNAIVAERLVTRPTAEWIEELDTEGVPAGPVYRVDEVFADPQVEHLAMVQRVRHPVLGDLGLIANALSIEGLSRELRRPAPEPGEDTHAVLEEFGIARERIAELERQGVI